jgi:hypothetical protein
MKTQEVDRLERLYTISRKNNKLYSCEKATSEGV